MGTVQDALERALTQLANGIEGGTLVIRVEHYHHFPDPIGIDLHFPDTLGLAVTAPDPMRFVVSDGPGWIRATGIAVSTQQEEPMTAIQITVDDVAKKLHPIWTDDKGDNDAVPPAAGSLTYTVHANADGSGGKLAVSADAADPFSADYVPGPDGDTGTISGTFNGSAFEPDGVTPIPDPPDAAYVTGPGGAVSATIV